MEDLCFNTQWSFNSFDDQVNSMNNMHEVGAFVDNTNQLYDHHAPNVDSYMVRPSKQLKTTSWNSCISYDHLMNQNLLHANQVQPKEEGVVSSNSTVDFTTYDTSHVQIGNQNHQAKKMATNKSRLQTPHEHILAERKRREKLSQRFIALSALVPGLKKMDKASVLGDAIKYLKTLQEKVNALEEQTNKETNVESVVFVKRYDMLADSDGGIISSSGGPVHDQLPEVEARFSGKDVLIKIHCEKKTGVVEETLAEIEKLHLSVINTTAMAFANYALDITVVAQMNEEFTMTMKDLVKNLCTSLKRFM